MGNISAWAEDFGMQKTNKYKMNNKCKMGK